MKRTLPFWVSGIFMLCILLFATSEKFFRAYLFGFLFWGDLPLGALGLLMIYQLTGGEWGRAAKRVLETLASGLLLLGFWSVPVFSRLERIYPWTKASTEVTGRRLYLNERGVILRGILYFLTWGAFVILLRMRNEERKKRWSAAGLVLLVLTVTFASVDWQMSVEPRWYSTIYGLLVVVGTALTAHSLVLAVLGLTKIPLSAKVARDLGNILLTLVMLWAYLSFMQYLVVWSGGLPRELPWYHNRTQEGWQWIALSLVVFQFFAPFLLLLFRASKEKALGWIGTGVFLVRIVDHYWMLIPGFHYKPQEVLLSALLIWAVMAVLWYAHLRSSLRESV